PEPPRRQAAPPPPVVSAPSCATAPASGSGGPSSSPLSPATSRRFARSRPRRSSGPPLPAELRPDRHASLPCQRATKEVRPMIEHRPAAESVPVLRALEPPPEQPVDIRKYASALRRSRLLIAAIVVTLTGLVLALSLILPKTYSAKATILLDESPEITASADAERRLATIQTLLTTRGVLATAARRLPGEPADT